MPFPWPRSTNGPRVDSDKGGDTKNAQKGGDNHSAPVGDSRTQDPSSSMQPPSDGEHYNTVNSRGGNVGGRNNNNHIHNMEEAGIEAKLDLVEQKVGSAISGEDEMACTGALHELLAIKKKLDDMTKRQVALEKQIREKVATFSPS